ncbi:hypothetical protein ACQP2K_20610 [Microbispora siamensis]
MAALTVRRRDPLKPPESRTLTKPPPPLTETIPRVGIAALTRFTTITVG